MVLYRPDQLVSLRNLRSWALLAFGAGAVNAGALLACQRFVSHVTGTVTRIGVDAGQLLALEYFLILFCFIAGAGAAVLLARRGEAVHTPRYARPLLLVSAILVGVALLGQAGALGPFGGTVESARDFVFLGVLSFAMGMQNAAVAVSTAMAVRTTHMTGPATDIGIALALLASGTRAERSEARRSIVLRVTKLFAFISGGAAMVPLCARFGFAAFVVPAVTCALATMWTYASAPATAADGVSRA
ncbi:MAG: DUF1275 domain-containing protein [Myxococcales bacterium]|nr:DUF1275 domain-containing protein [Myxococcales bacterium]